MIFNTGSHLHEVLTAQKQKILDSSVLKNLKLVKKDFILASLHREETVDSKQKLLTILDGLEKMAKHFGKRVVFSAHPRTRSRIKLLNYKINHRLIKVIQPLSFTDYISLQKACFCMVSDSGTATEEASMLGVPTVTPRASHERPEGFDAGVLVMSGLDSASLIDGVRCVTSVNFEQGTVSEYNQKKRFIQNIKNSHKLRVICRSQCLAKVISFLWHLVYFLYSSLFTCCGNYIFKKKI